MYVQLILNDHDAETEPWCWGNEPIYRNGKYVGIVTTASYGYTFKKQVNVTLNFYKRDDFSLTLTRVFISVIYLGLSRIYSKF